MKGQTAIEYLMTYGWAILIILIVAGVLAYYGIFAPSGFLAPTARCTGNIMIRTPWSVSTGGTLILDLENRVGQTISVTNIFPTVGTQQLSACANPAGLANLAGGNHNATTCTTNTTITGASTGSTYSATVAIEYNISTGQKFNSSCTISGTY